MQDAFRDWPIRTKQPLFLSVVPLPGLEIKGYLRAKIFDMLSPRTRYCRQYRTLHQESRLGSVQISKVLELTVRGNWPPSLAPEPAGITLVPILHTKLAECNQFLLVH